jgi:MFS family permease
MTASARQPQPTPLPATGSSPRRSAYAALLACSTLGVLASTIISAPVNVIAHAIGTSPRGIVFAVSAFTLAMVLCAPLSGWLCQRYGSRPVLGGSLALMVVGQAGAAFSQDLAFLVAMRAVQGVACSAVPPAIQQVLGLHWAGNRARVMAAWAAAIGLGQALGPPLGGLIADTLGWRWVFLTHASLSAVLLVLCVTVVPVVPGTRAPLHASGMLTLAIGTGSLLGALAWVGQQGSPLVAVSLVAIGLLALLAHAGLGRTGAGPFVAPGLLTERRYTASTAAAATVMACLGVSIVTTPLHLGRDLGLDPGHIGLVMLSLAVAMTVCAPLSSRITERLSSRRTMRGGLALLAAGLVALPLAAAAPRSAVVPLTVAALTPTGCAIGVVQATSAHGLMTSPAAADGVALGLHNMLRFAGLFVGYSWVAIAYPTGRLGLVYAVPLLLVVVSFALAAPRPQRTTTRPALPTAERVLHDR